MSVRSPVARTSALILALAITACSAASTNGGALSVGMTPDQAVQVMGPPDLKDSIPDPNHSGATVLRYAWVDSGKVAVFGPNDRVASVQQMETTQKAQEEVETRTAPPQQFDPIQTPLDYTFFPIKAAFIYIGAGLNCAAGGGCQKPKLPDPTHG